ncbi:MAG: hypothetical protein R6U17_03655 [Thermoplasmata archaeon]
MDLWRIGFSLLIVGIAIPLGYGLYQFVLTPVAWYWRLTILFIAAGLMVMIVAAIKERASSSKPKEKY